MHPRVLIVGTMPYDPDLPSRSFCAYFSNWEKNRLWQIFSNPRSPIQGQCGSLYQLTDANMLKRRLGLIKEPGKIYQYNELEKTRKKGLIDKKHWSNTLIEKLYKIGSKKYPIIYLMRKALWNKKYWCTNQLINWVDEFQPECVFLYISDDFFINEIALFIADKYQIPIMCCIGDDYYFNKKKSINLLYHIYRKKYTKLIDRVFSHKCSAVYISDKIRDKYNSEFNIKGETVYLTSSLKRRPFSYINAKDPFISYCGNIRHGRNHSLVDIANVLHEINPKYKLVVYSAERNQEYTRPLLECQGIQFEGSIPYEKVTEVFEKSDIVVIVEGFKEKDINLTRYSLSTKVADSITSGCQIITYGSFECGAMEYMQSIGCSIVCDSKDKLKEDLLSLINDLELQKYFYERSAIALTEHHNLQKSISITEHLFENLLKE